MKLLSKWLGSCDIPLGSRDKPVFFAVPIDRTIYIGSLIWWLRRRHLSCHWQSRLCYGSFLLHRRWQRHWHHRSSFCCHWWLSSCVINCCRWWRRWIFHFIHHCYRLLLVYYSSYCLSLRLQRHHNILWCCFGQYHQNRSQRFRLSRRRQQSRHRHHRVDPSCLQLGKMDNEYFGVQVGGWWPIPEDVACLHCSLFPVVFWRDLMESNYCTIYQPGMPPGAKCVPCSDGNREQLYCFSIHIPDD